MNIVNRSVLDGKKKITTHETVKDTFGFIPYSVWNFTKSKKLMELVGDNKKGRVADAGNTLSELNPDTVLNSIKLWSDKGDVVLDPFLNRGTTPILSSFLGRIGLGNDVVKQYVEEVLLQKSNLIKRKHNWAKNIHINCGDARDIVNTVKNKFGYKRIDYAISSPPFWDVEKYVSVEGQMSDIEDYNKFLEDYEYIIGELYKILEPDKFVTYIVNDFRRDGKYIWFSGDTIKCFMNKGFDLWDFVINVVRTPHISGIGNAVMKQKRTLKYHEYVLTFKKVG